jgi:hypothetical protein
MAFLRRFFGFWYDFLVGDRWELFLGPIAALALVSLAITLGLAPGIAGVLLFALITGIVALSLTLALRG